MPQSTRFPQSSPATDSAPPPDGAPARPSGEPGLPRLAGGGDPSRADRVAALRQGLARPRAGGAGDGGARGDAARRRPPHPLPDRERARGRPDRGPVGGVRRRSVRGIRGRPIGGSSVRMPGRPLGRTRRIGARGAPLPGHRAERELRRRTGAARRPAPRSGPRRGARLHRRSGLPPPPQRRRALIASSFALPGQSSASPRRLSGTSGVPMRSWRSGAPASTKMSPVGISRLVWSSCT